MPVTIDAAAFKRRLHVLQRDIKENKQFDGIHALVTTLGKGEAETQGVCTSLLHIWLLGCPFANTAITVTADKAVIITSAKQEKYLSGLKSGSVDIWVRPKEADECKDVYIKMLDEYVTGKIGRFTQDTLQSPLATVWRELFDERVKEKELEVVDVASPFKKLLEYKDEDELRAVRTASKASMGIMTRYFAEEMATVVDEGIVITHAEFSKKIADTITSDRILKQLKLGSEFDPDMLDWAYQPIVQSGHDFNLSLSATSDDKRLTAGVIYASIGMSYKFYCSAIGRTYLIDATKEQEQNYSILLAIQKKILAAITDGAKCSEVYQVAADYLLEKDPSLVEKFVPKVGWGVGIELQEPKLDLSASNNAHLSDGMTLCVEVAFRNLLVDGDKTKPYDICLIDTVRVTGEAPIVFTDSPRNKSDIAFSLSSQDEMQPKSRARSTTPASTTRTTRSTRNDGREKEELAEVRILNHQKELKKTLHDRGLQKYSQTSALSQGESKPEFKKYESYKRETQLPTMKDLRIMLDNRAQTVIIPINGRPVPFHINSYKNGSKNEEGEYVYLRLNFNSPDVGIGKRDDVPFENPQATFIKSVTLRSRDIERMNDTFKAIQEMKKEATKKEAERKEMEDVVQQDKLIEVKERRPQRLEPVFVRPMPEGKRVAGSLDIHKNGVRYQSPLGKEQQIDVLFSNVENLFFQPCDNELIVLIHFHLKNPIIIGKRKTQDVQFYRDATDITFDDTGNRKRRYRYGDEDELEQEQEERKFRASLNKEFKAFAEHISKASNGKLDVDIPFRELGFNGVPFRANVLLQPTTECLVQLIDTPFLVVKLADVEIAYLERVQFGLREFDLVFVYKDYSKPVTHINTIPVSQLDPVKDWLDEMDIPFYEGPVNMKWPVIMKTVSADPHEFYQTGGWSFLATESDDENNEGGSGGEIDEESEFEVSDFEDEASDSYAEESAEDLSENSFDEEEGSGEDWNELEEQAAREDRRKDGDEERRRR